MELGDELDCDGVSVFRLAWEGIQDYDGSYAPCQPRSITDRPTARP